MGDDGLDGLRVLRIMMGRGVFCPREVCFRIRVERCGREGR